MKKLASITVVLASICANVSTATAGPFDWIRETLFPVQIRVVEKIVPVLVPPETRWAIWAILIGVILVILILLRGRKKVD